jgi:Domain of unknown function (DUF4333)
LKEIDVMPHKITARQLCTAALAIGLGGCTQLDHHKIERGITDECAAKRLTLKSVSCPSGHKAKAGATFDCTGETADGDKLVFHVTASNDRGDITWQLDGEIFDEEALGHKIEKPILDQTQAAAVVTCPPKASVAVPGKTFTCDVSLAGQPRKVAITVGADGHNTWKLQP